MQYIIDEPPPTLNNVVLEVTASEWCSTGRIFVGEKMQHTKMQYIIDEPPPTLNDDVVLDVKDAIIQNPGVWILFPDFERYLNLSNLRRRLFYKLRVDYGDKQSDWDILLIYSNRGLHIKLQRFPGE